MGNIGIKINGEWLDLMSAFVPCQLCNEPVQIKDLEDIIMKANQEVLDITTKSVTRFEVIDHTKKKVGRIVVEYNVNVELSLQDENRTLKVFLTDKK